MLSIAIMFTLQHILIENEIPVTINVGLLKSCIKMWACSNNGSKCGPAQILDQNVGLLNSCNKMWAWSNHVSKCMPDQIMHQNVGLLKPCIKMWACSKHVSKHFNIYLNSITETFQQEHCLQIISPCDSHISCIWNSQQPHVTNSPNVDDA